MTTASFASTSDELTVADDDAGRFFAVAPAAKKLDIVFCPLGGGLFGVRIA
jgi:hypothetical protein